MGLGERPAAHAEERGAGVARAEHLRGEHARRPEQAQRGDEPPSDGAPFREALQRPGDPRGALPLRGPPPGFLQGAALDWWKTLPAKPRTVEEFAVALRARFQPVNSVVDLARNHVEIVGTA
mgnify:CR=1 FL=1